ncbi:GDSL-type esterase/lipase family protein [Mucilaginibacter sp. OK098]|uniref:GDSL-type esterase/lipase family protein n=1 Tax=Mucilaginibacter sp. OK098 TaxID=1855297 RepID=UPI000918F2CE|nr:GDSL-type esterase/lipase family protein [Mucilaginibacter sp. OK098]SHN11457.1 Acetyl esterase/lipase [Mucilaginibacter sp. OK098]
MNKLLFTTFIILFAIGAGAQQKVIQLYNGAAPGSENWAYNEKEVNTPYSIVYNVSHPTLTAYLPDPAIATGTAVIVCPGGGFYILGMKDEGVEVARWLNKKGVAAFILKYRLAQSLTDNPGQELTENMKKSDFVDKIKAIIPFSVADGKEAIKYVRAHAADYGVSTNKVGIIGFSAGGTVAASSAFNYTADNRPDFVAPIYAYMPPALQGSIAGDAPPMFICAATNDELGLASHSADLYSKWLASKHVAELHIYEKGGHGFGLRKQNIPTDTWIDRFGDWLDLQGLLKPKVAPKPQPQDWPGIGRYADQNGKTPPPANGENRVIYMGDSITDFWINNDSTFFKSNSYINRGISGQTTGQMLVRFREDVINLQPKVVVILAGINDIAQNNGPTKPEDTFGNIVSMAELAKANRIKVVISSILPANRFPWRQSIIPTEKVISLNQMLKAYADKNNVVYLDYYSAMVDNEKGLPANLAKDGVHPTLEGYKMMEPLAQKAIEKAMKER